MGDKLALSVLPCDLSSGEEAEGSGGDREPSGDTAQTKDLSEGEDSDASTTNVCVFSSLERLARVVLSSGATITPKRHSKQGRRGRGNQFEKTKTGHTKRG